MGCSRTPHRWGRLESLVSDKPSDAYYNLLVQGFGDGHLSLKKEVPPGFASLTDPYDPDANRLYRGFAFTELNDQSYYKGRLYFCISGSRRQR